MINHPSFRNIRGFKKDDRISFFKLISYDHTLRNKLYEEVHHLFEQIVYLDVYISVAKIAANRGFSYAEALPSDQNVLSCSGMFHPALSSAVGNSLDMSSDNNLFF